MQFDSSSLISLKHVDDHNCSLHREFVSKSVFDPFFRILNGQTEYVVVSRMIKLIEQCTAVSNSLFAQAYVA